ncbi:glycerate kinase [Leucothrix arctica]|uniref:Glycerate kinase n=1 Tax=Leucothrix arctica TaxID=1481894 RepID=A0A317CEW3_9GAMM|nr:glycerate kinase [Leucothrix arctica]PWQ94850.1 glycerate kinase [Leucothrix arctica]
MKIVIAPDSFKESLSSEAVAQAIAKGFASIFPSAEQVLLPVADGGEGTTDALIAATSGELFKQSATGPLGTPVDAFWGLLGDGKTAVVETAAASGLDLISVAQRDPLNATTRGTGELILAAIDKGARHIIVGLGGSATNDAGAGMLQALGASFLDADGSEIPVGGAGLALLDRIDLTNLDARLKDVTFNVACDVDNPLVGESGASAIFGPQKGATPEQVALLDKNLSHFAAITLAATDKNILNIAGAGAAGGLGGAFLGFLNAQLKSGIDIVLDTVEFEKNLAGASLVITGEGRIDSQTVRGKTPVGVSKRAKAFADIPVIALAGSVASDADVVFEHGIDALFSVVPGVVTLDEALSNADENLFKTARNAAQLLKLGQSLPS